MKEQKKHIERKLGVLRSLTKARGPGFTLGDALKEAEKQLEQFMAKYGNCECPKCDGSGKESFKVNTNPDPYYGGWNPKFEYQKRKCSLCNGSGYTEKPMTPKYKRVFEGYETKPEP